ncbi:hypothetical protein [Paractinoplanes atraurantiacus]|uniref:hypothetical protein n=1 Tax=Paractinoplanes atraurantiacus TaxID=1036182 RepID=UPI001FE62D11|nr:hypothetical protein [Actinoplanes atraurantiacus]
MARPAPPSLRHHYIAYRAYARTKVACLRHAQGDPSAAADVIGYPGLALQHLRAGEVRLVLVRGAPGTGKSTQPGGSPTGWVRRSSPATGSARRSPA